MKTIHRFPLNFIGDTIRKIPKSAALLSVTMHPSNEPMLYCIVEQGDPEFVEIVVRGIMTGEDFEMEELGLTHFMGTLNRGQWVSHFFIVSDERINQ